MLMTRLPLLLLLMAALSWALPDRLTSASHREVSGCVAVDDSMRPCSYSSLWGVAGEKWQPVGRLPDFSYAGYHAGEAQIPTPRATLNFKRDFHAAGDGRTDDSQALLNAIQSIKQGVLFIPEGTYLISKRIDISRGNLILRGAGPNKTILLFPNSLTDLFGNKAT